MSVTSSFSFPRGTDVSLPFSAVTPTSISGWSLQMNIKVSPADAVDKLILDTGSNAGITITDSTNGNFTVAITAAQTTTLGVGTFVWDVWRTDTGSNDLLATGTMQITGSVRYGNT
ncbi:MAG: hypothetical protein KGL39_33355 [Patescibacteria group bacterium]|nr:hypothetical protein [Patescibacteria group bacterium]